MYSSVFGANIQIELKNSSKYVSFSCFLFSNVEVKLHIIYSRIVLYPNDLHIWNWNSNVLSKKAIRSNSVQMDFWPETLNFFKLFL